MVDGMNITFRDREFNRAIDELADASGRTDIEVLTGQAIQLVRALVFHTRLALKKRGKTVRFRAAGRARAGWWPSWLGLGVFSTPHGASSQVLSLSEGRFKDGRQRRNQPYVEMTNTCPYIETLDGKDKILVRAYTQRFRDMQRELTRRYERLLRRKSGR